MKIKIDENLPVSLASLFDEFGHDADTVEDEGLLGHSDDEVWFAAKSEDRLIVTQDLDFADMRRFAGPGNPGVILLRLDNFSKPSIMRRIHEVLRSEDLNWRGCIVVVNQKRIRVRKFS